MTRHTPSVPNPRQLAAEATARLRALADPTRAAQQRSYFKEKVSVYGIPVPRVRSLVRKLLDEIGTGWGAGEALRFCDVMSARPELEAKLVGVLVLERYHKQLDKKVLGIVRRWIMADRFASWAAIDALAPAVVTPLVRRFPDLIPRIEGWTSSRSLWLRRAAAVTFVPLVRRGEQLDAAYRVVRSLFADPEDLIHKACGWLLREAGKSDERRLEGFLLKHGPKIPRTTVRYAIERFPEEERKRLLHATRPG